MKYTIEIMREFERIREAGRSLGLELRQDDDNFGAETVRQSLEDLFDSFGVKICSGCDKLLHKSDMLGHDRDTCPTCAQHEFDMKDDDYRRRILGENI